MQPLYKLMEINSERLVIDRMSIKENSTTIKSHRLLHRGTSELPMNRK